jgi:ribonuclease J
MPNEPLKDSFTKKHIAPTPDEVKNRPVKAPRPEPSTQSDKKVDVFIPQNNQPVVFFQASTKGSTAILADGSKERLGADGARQEQPARPAQPKPNRRPQSGGGRGMRPQRGAKRARNMYSVEDSDKKKVRRVYNKFTAEGTPKLRIIPAGGVEEIGKNMTIFEYGNDILVVDMGLSFPDSDMLGIDYVIPDSTYLEEHKENIRGIIFTHGHLDHIGAVPHIIEKIGLPRMYGSDVTIGLLKNRMDEYNIKYEGRTNVVSPDGDSVQLGVFKITFFRLNHSIPGAMGLEIDTPYGRLVYATDWKMDFQPADNKPADLQKIAAIGSKGIKILFSDSTNVDKPGHTMSESVVEETMRKIIDETKGRLVIAMFSTLINRMQQVINAAAAHGRKVMIVGMSMQKSLEMAVSIKAMTLPPNTLITDRQARSVPEEKLVILCTGGQGEDRAALTRMAKGEHKTVKIHRGDTVVISSSPIPGNERSVANVMDLIYRAGGEVIYNKQLDVHTSGHASQEDLKIMLALIKPEYFFPIHGERHKLIHHASLAVKMGVLKEKTIVSSNGQIIELLPDGKMTITDEYIPNGFVMVDGLGVGDVGNIVLRDRQAMAQNGMFVSMAIVERNTGKLKTSPDIISRGFIYMRENEELVNEARNLVRNICQQMYGEGKKPELSEVRDRIRNDLSKLLYTKTEREPLVISVVKEV